MKRADVVAAQIGANVGAVQLSLDPTRKLHRIARKIVETEGEDAPRFLYFAFDLFNAALFAGQLGAAMIRITPAGSPRAAGDYSPRDRHGVNSVIRIAPAIYKRGMRYVLGTLLHEMVHAFCEEILHDSEPGYRGHGPLFASKCNELAKVLGFPPVAPRSKAQKAAGIAPAGDWPELVPCDDDAPPAKARKPKAEPSTSTGGGEGDGPDPDGGGVDLEAVREAGRQDERDDVLHWLREQADTLDAANKGKSAATVRRLCDEIENAVHV